MTKKLQKQFFFFIRYLSSVFPRCARSEKSAQSFAL